MENNQENMIYVALDGDSIGQMVGRAVIADDENSLHEVSLRIDSARNFVEHWASKHGGQLISSGGDESTLKIPQSQIEELESLRQDIEHAFGFTITVGVGSKLSEAGLSLLVGKMTGKNKIVMFGPEVEQEIKAASERIQSGSGSDEDKKISQAYLEPKGDDMKESEMEDCEYCDDLSHNHASQEAPVEEQVQDHEHNDDDCEYCNELNQAPPIENIEVPQEEQVEEHDHQDDDCEWCRQSEQEQANRMELDQTPRGAQDSPSDYIPEEDQTIPEEEAPQDELAIAAERGDLQAQDEHSKEGMKNIIQAIEGEESSAEVADEMATIDDTDLAVGTNMEDGISRPDDFEDPTPNDMGLSEENDSEDETPDISEVLHGGLENHADSIQREKVVQMIGNALEGFKANKQVLEMAKEQAPEFYQSSIAMLRAMIEMAKMLGLSAQEQAPQEGQPQQAQQQEAPAQQSADEDKSVGQGLGKLSSKHSTKHIARTPMPEGGINAKGQKKVTDPNGRVRFINMNEPRVMGPNGVPIKPGQE